MTNQIDNTTGGVLSDPLDRRSALKKAAAAGAIAWTAPMIISTKAHAATCTPACAPDLQPITMNVTARRPCEDEIDEIEAAVGINNGEKWAIVKVLPQGQVTCPCGGNPIALPVVTFNASTVWYKGNTACPPATGNPEASTAKHWDPSKPNEFIVYKSGSLGNGWYSPGGAGLCISIACPDDTGDLVYGSCKYQGCFYYDPNHASCDPQVIGGIPAQFTVIPGTCKTGCQPGC